MCCMSTTESYTIVRVGNKQSTWWMHKDYAVCIKMSYVSK